VTPARRRRKGREAAVPEDRLGLPGRVAIVTGAGKGIGAAVALALADAGADSVLVARTEADVEQVAKLVRERGRRCVAVAGDVNDLGLLADVVERTAGEFGAIDIVVNNAGGSVSAPLLDTSVTALERAFHFNVSVPLELSRLAVPHLLQRHGASIVNISSIAGRHAVRGGLTHSVTKAAESQLTRVMAADLAPRIRVNAVLPGAIETAALKWYLSQMDPRVREGMTRRTLMRRNGTPEDIADAVLFLVSPAARWITGKLLEVDGGAEDNLIPSTVPDLEGPAAEGPAPEGPAVG
jgi:7-alpha-hydroxysteroid dehydrogenase